MADLPDQNTKYHLYLHDHQKADEAIDGWTIDDIIGHGGHGVVARVHDVHGLRGALKITDPARCQIEAGILQKFGGDNIPLLLTKPTALPEVDVPAAYYVMELADSTLDQHFREADSRSYVPLCTQADDEHYVRIEQLMSRGRREREAFAVARAVLAAIATARPHVHGDICPNNVLLFKSDQALQAKVADWGNARVHHPGKTSYTMLGGKELWCPPSTRALSVGRSGARAEPPTDKMDVYNVGALVCWILTGTVPDQLARWEVRDLPASRRGLPLDKIDKAWHEFIIGTTQADRELRFTPDKAGELLENLAAEIDDRRPIVDPGPVMQKKRVTPRRGKPHILAALIAITVSLLTSLLVDAVKHTAAHAPSSPATDQKAAPSSGLEPNLRCMEADWVCDPHLLQYIAKSRGIGGEGSPSIPEVRHWFRGPLTRNELVNGNLVSRAYKEAIGLRLRFSSGFGPVTSSGREDYGLLVMLNNPSAIPPHLARVQIPGYIIAWLPMLPPARPRGHMLPTVEKTEKYNLAIELYPYTAIFDISGLENFRILGFAVGGVSHTRNGDPIEAHFIHLEYISEWPTRSTERRDLYPDIVLNLPVYGNGTCLVELYDVGLSDAIVDCARPHSLEVIGTVSVPLGQGNVGSSSDVTSMCRTQFGNPGFGGATIQYEMTARVSAMPAPTGYQHMLCLVESSGDTVWIGAQSASARSNR